LTRLSWTCS